MAPQNDTELMALLREAMVLPAHQRREFVRSRCRDEQMRRRAEGLLSQEDSATLLDARERTFGSVAPTTERAPSPSSAGIGRLGSFHLLSVLGEGGMGVVYLAEQDRPRRVVALKV